jgi:hypothetical protein
MFVGLPLGANPSRLSTWKPLLTSIQGKLGLWKGSLLSMARRIFCLIKSVLSYLPPFYMFVFLMPQSIIKTIFSILGRFLWSGSSDVSEMCKVAWNKVIKLKDHRGLGLGSLQGKNLALMFQWIWHLDGGNVGGWQEIIFNKYRPLFSIGLPSFNCHLIPYMACYSEFIFLGKIKCNSQFHRLFQTW